MSLKDPLLSVSLFCHLASIILCALILSETLALYKSFTYLLTYLFTFAAKNCQQALKINICKIQSHSRSSMLAFLRSSLPVLVMISGMSVPISKHFHARQDNSG